MTEETLFADALDAPDRAAFLDTHCPDPAVRRKVEELLAAHDQAGGFLRSDPDLTRTHEPHPADTDVQPLLGPPSRPNSLGRLGHYEILEVVGKGGFGTVLKAFDDRLHRVVAVKVLAPQLAASGSARARFLREGRTAAAVRDPHVVSIHAVSGDDEPVPFLVMEFIAGQTLQQKLDKAGPLPPAEVLRIGGQIARGLAAAHATGLIHRDVKPANILLENGVERVKLSDFGLARAADDASLSQSGVVAGTPMYMSPEQARGEPVDARSDLFSLGSVLYAMCAGRPPFRAESALAVLKRVCEEDPRPVRQVNPQVPDWLADVVAKLHAKEPADRFQSAAEVADLLTGYAAELAQRGTVSPHPTVGRPVRNAAAVRRVRAKVFAAASWLLAGLVVVAALVAWRLRDRTDGPDQTDLRPLDPAVWGTFVNPTGNGQAELLDSGFGTLGMPGSVVHELNPATNLFAPRLVREVDGDFRFEASVLAFNPAPAGTGHRTGGTWRAAGLLVWQDDGHFFRFERACHTEQRDGAPYLQCEAFPGPAADKREYFPMPEELTRLQVERRGELFTLRTSGDGAAWRDWHTVRMPVGRKLQVGLVACNNSTRLFVAGFRPPTLTRLESPAPEVPPAAGFVPLFNGKDLSGWDRSPRPDLGEWTVTDGVLEGRTKQRDYLFTQRRDYRDFHLRVEAKVSPGGDGGLLFRCERGLSSKFGTAHGYETEISSLPDVPHGSLRLGPEGPDNTVLAKAVADRAGKWFTQEVIVRGNHIVVKVDGEEVLDHTTAKEHYARGHIGLQVWGEKTVVQFRKVEVMELPAEPPALPATWRRFRVPGAGFSVMLPPDPESREHVFPTGKKGKVYAAEVPAGGEAFVAVTVPLDETTKRELARDPDEAFRRQLLGATIPGNVKVSEVKRVTAAGGLSGSEVVARDSDSGKHLFIRVFVIHDGVGVLIAAGDAPTPSPALRAYLDSVRVEEPPPADAGFVPLFNGKDLAGWKPNPNWTVRDGVLRSVPVPTGPGVTGSDLVSSRTDFADFHLRAEVRINEGGNSGILFRAPDAWKENVYEAQIAGDIDPVRTGSLWHLGPARAVRQCPPPGEWFTLEVIAVGPELTVRVNGAETTRWTDPNRAYSKGRLLLQQYTRETVVEFRKLEIQEPPAGAFDRRRLWNRWRLVAAERDGQPLPAADPARADWVEFTADDRLTMFRDGKEWAGTYTVTRADPAEIDLVCPGQPTVRALARFYREKLVLAHGPPGQPRPTGFDTAAGAGVTVASYTRAGPTADRFVPLFNGKDLTGWTPDTTHPGKWEVTDGVLTGSEPGYLFTARPDYRDFRLRVQARVNDGGHAGLVFRGPRVVQRVGPDLAFLGVPRSYRAYLHHSTAADLRDRRTGSLSIAPAGDEPAPRALAVVHDPALTKPDEWFTLELTADGNRFRTAINGREVTDCTDPAGTHSAGHIAVGVVRPGTRLQVRAIELLELPARATEAKPAALPTWLDMVRKNAWPNGSAVTVGFLGATPAVEAAVRAAAADWGRHANLRFEFPADAAKAMIRVTSDPRYMPEQTRPHLKAGKAPGSSALGTRALDRAEFPDASFWLDPSPAHAANLTGTARHEFGHALGLGHEQDRVNPAQGYGLNFGPTGTPLDRFDPLSVMIHPDDPKDVPAGKATKQNLVLSEQDNRLIAAVYPRPPAPPPAVAPFDAGRAKAHQQAWAAHLGVPADLRGAAGLDFRLIPPGEFGMGFTDAERAAVREELKGVPNVGDFERFCGESSGPRHTVRITRAFYLGKYEVTAGQYKRFLDATKYAPTSPIDWRTFVTPGQEDALPVMGVSWADADAFCQWLGTQDGRTYALPTEAQWEYAARAGGAGRWWFGDDPAKLIDHAVTGRPGRTAAPVGRKLANPWGVYDLYGNASEWCRDWHSATFYQRSPIDDPVCDEVPSEASSGRVNRGGAWSADGAYSRSAFRVYDHPIRPGRPAGFRVMTAVDRPPPTAAAAASLRPVVMNNWGTLVDPSGSCRVQATVSDAAFTVPGGKGLFLSPATGLNRYAPRWLWDAAGDFTYQVSVRNFPAARPGQGRAEGDDFAAAGFVVWADDQNFVRFERAWWDAGTTSRSFWHAEEFVNGKRGDHLREAADAAAFHLRIERRGGRLTLRRSADGATWDDWHTVNRPIPADRVKVGLVAVNGTAVDFHPVFENLATAGTR